MRRIFAAGALVMGIGLVAAPFAFGMFDRAPKGAVMIDDFRPFMTNEEVELFRGYLQTIDAADAETRLLVKPGLIDSGAVDSADFDSQLSAVAGFDDQWPAILADMTDLVDRMERNVDSYQAVDALPSFDLFPWFFVVPGLLISLFAGLALHQMGSGGSARRDLAVVAALGLGVALAPGVFQMFSRAPAGSEMISDFQPMMTSTRVRAVQGYFITMGAAEGQLRNRAIPMLAEVDPATRAELPAIDRFSTIWPAIVTDFAPMISAMSDNLDNFAAIDALPDFALFPWFFLVPGLLVIGFAWSAQRQGRPRVADREAALTGHDHPASQSEVTSDDHTTTKENNDVNDTIRGDRSGSRPDPSGRIMR